MFFFSVLVLDEVDHLFNVFKANRFDDKNNLLVNLVKWTQLYKMNLTVIGIANSLDLIDRCSEAFSLADSKTINFYLKFKRQTIVLSAHSHTTSL